MNDGVVCFGVDAELANLESGRLFSAMPEMRATDLRPGHCSEPLGKITLSSPHFKPLMTRYSLHALNFVINVMHDQEQNRLKWIKLCRYWLCTCTVQKNKVSI